MIIIIKIEWQAKFVKYETQRGHKSRNFKVANHLGEEELSVIRPP